MGSRAAGNESAVAWAAEAGEGASTGTFADAAGFGKVVFNCTAGVASLDALAAAGETNLAGKLLIDVANPLDFSQGMPPSLSVCNTDSLGERIQRAFPATHVVKALNTVNCDVMVEPARVPREHVVFVCGNDPKLSARRPACLASSAGLPSVCSTSAMSSRHVVRRCTCRCGSTSWGSWVHSTSISNSRERWNL